MQIEPMQDWELPGQRHSRKGIVIIYDDVRVCPGGASVSERMCAILCTGSKATTSHTWLGTALW